MVGMEITHPVLNTPILIPFGLAESLTVDRVLSTIEKKNQSKNGLMLDDQVTVRAVIVHQPQGSGPNRPKRRAQIVNLDEWMDSHSGHGGCFIRVRYPLETEMFVENLVFFKF
jgi:hypothetical protein